MHTIPPQGIVDASLISEGTAAIPYGQPGEQRHERFVDPSFQALSGRLMSTVRRHTFNKDSLFVDPEIVLVPLLGLVLRYHAIHK